MRGEDGVVRSEEGEQATTSTSSSKKQATTYAYLVLKGNESVLITDALGRRTWWRPAKEGSAWNLWYGGNGQSFDFKQLASAAKGGGPQVVNRLENHREVCTKSGLASTLARIQSALKSGPLEWVPETHTLPGRPATTDQALWARFTRRYKEMQEAGQGVTWIVKPVSLNRGNGIEVFNRLEDILKHLDAKKPESKWIVQKYIDQPALVQGRKFDIRAYVLVTPDGSAFMCKEAYVRTSSTPYKLEDLSDKSAHLTNDAVQKHLDSYHAYEDHCKMDLAALQEHLGPSIDVQGKVVPAMRECARHVFGMAVPRLNPRRFSFCWELLGLDFMIDARGQVYLIEVNTSPALFRAGAYLADLLPRVVEECVQKAVDPYLPPPPGTPADQLPTPLDSFERLDLVQFAASGRRPSDGAGGGSMRAGRALGGVGGGSINRRAPGAQDTSAVADGGRRRRLSEGNGSCNARSAAAVWR